MPQAHNSAEGTTTTMADRSGRITIPQLLEVEEEPTTSKKRGTKVAVRDASRRAAARTQTVDDGPTTEELVDDPAAKEQRRAKEREAVVERERLGFGDRIRRRRDELRLTQTDVANALGLTRAAIAQWESHATSPTVIAIKNLARVLEVQPEWLLFGITTATRVEYRAPEGIAFVNEVRFMASDTGYQMERVASMGWGIPETQLRLLHHVSRPDRCVMMEVPDDSLGPEYEYGDRALVDLVDIKPTTGVYVIWNGVAASLYHLQVVPRAGGAPQLRMRNKTAEPIDADLDDVTVIGKVKGRWSR